MMKGLQRLVLRRALFWVWEEFQAGSFVAGSAEGDDGEREGLGNGRDLSMV